MSENKECLFYIDHNPPECSGTWGSAIYKGACKINSTSCNDTDKCFIKLLYQQVEQKEQEYEDYKIANAEFEKENDDLRNKLQAKELELIMTKADLCRGCQYKNDYQAKEQECEELKKIINETKSSSLDLKSFLVGEAVQNEYEQQLDQLKAENESLKDSLKMFSSTLDWALKSQVGLYKRQIDSSVPDDWEYEEVLVLVEQYIEKIKQTLAEIKEIAEVEIECKTYEIENDCFNETRCKALNEHIDFIKQILQKISEVENDNRN